MSKLFHIIEMRQRLGYDEDDNSHDDEIESMDPVERVRLIAGWELGDETWADVFIGWFREQGLVLSPSQSEGGGDD